MDGPSEVTIRVLENFLRQNVEGSPRTWVQELPLAEFMVNNAVSISTDFTPFYLNTSAHLITPVSMIHGGASKGSQNEAVKETLERMKTAPTEAQTNFERVQRRMANAINRSRRSEQYNIGDEVVQYNQFEELLPTLASKTSGSVGWTLHNQPSGIDRGLQGGLGPQDGRSTLSSISIPSSSMSVQRNSYGRWSHPLLS